MIVYRRPEVPPGVFYDEAGNVVEYGRRWDGSPPEDSYSRTNNTERFAPLHTVAEALIAFLREEYQVSVVEGTSPEGGRTVEIIPESPGAKSLLIQFSAFPGIIIRIKAADARPFPICGCDACDNTWQECADELEAFVLRGVETGFYGVDGPGKPWLRRCPEPHT